MPWFSSSLDAALRGPVLGVLRAARVLDADAEEVWNDAFLAMIEHAPTLEPLGVGLRRFILRAAHNRGIDRIRGAINRREVALTPPPTPPEPALFRQWTREGPRPCNDASLPARPLHAAVIEMTARGLTAGEIAAVLDKSEASVAEDARSEPEDGSPTASREAI